MFCGNRPRPYLLPVLLSAFVLLTAGGCSMMRGAMRPLQKFNPRLSMDMTRAELVDYLNGQRHELHSWNTSNAVVHYYKKGIPVPVRLSGSVACEAPRNFRLKAGNVLASADLGTNRERCWFRMKTPESDDFTTWHHADSELVQEAFPEMPRLDPEWLMMVLGVEPLHEDDYTLSEAPGGKPELWLSSIIETGSGEPLRRVVKVDAVSGVISEHALYDKNGHLLASASMKYARPKAGQHLPHTVELSFPQMGDRLVLILKNVSTNSGVNDGIWQMPPSDGSRFVDLGMLCRQQLIAQGHGGLRTAPYEHPDGKSPSVELRDPDAPVNDGNWDSLESPWPRQESPGDGSFYQSSDELNHSPFYGASPSRHLSPQEPDWEDDRGWEELRGPSRFGAPPPEEQKRGFFSGMKRMFGG